jgi:predicted transcriptional regulator
VLASDLVQGRRGLTVDTLADHVKIEDPTVRRCADREHHRNVG